MTKLKLPCPFGGRSIPEWIGKTPDSKVPDKVRDRVFARAKGICHVSGRKIAAGEAWELEHVIALKDGGENRESNLAPALVGPHKDKSRREAKERAKIGRTRKKHIGATRPKRSLRSRGFDKVEKCGKIDKAAISKAAMPRTGGLAAQYQLQGKE